MRLYPYKLTLACAVPHKGVDPDVINMIVRFLRGVGMVRFAYSCDREKSLNAMTEKACTQSGRHGTHADSEAVPGVFSYRCVRTLEEQTRTMLHARQAHGDPHSGVSPLASVDAPACVLHSQ